MQQNTTPSVQQAIAEALARGTDEQIVNSRRSANRKSTLAAIATAIFFVGMLAAFLVGYFATGIAANTIWVGLALVAAVGTVHAINTDGKYTQTAATLQPLADTSRCDSALYLVENYDSARQVRDAIVNSGRQLYVADLDAMQALTDEERRKATQLVEDERHRAACARLHDVVAA